MLRFALAVLVIAASTPAFADEDEDLLSSVYTESGYELRRDPRIFTLFTALNIAGFTRAEQARTDPFPRYVLHPIREKLRAALLTAGEKIRPGVDLFLDTHPLPIEAYVDAALALEGEGEFRATAASPEAMKGLEKMLSETYRSAKLEKVGRQLAPDFRSLFKRLRDQVDEPFAKLRAAYRLREEDAPVLALLPNPLDAATAALARRAPDGSHVVVFGAPMDGRPFDLQPALRAYSRLLADEAAAKVPTDGLTAVMDSLRGVNLLADVTPHLFIEDALRQAVEARLWSKDAPYDLEAAFRKGYILIREYSKSLEEGPEAFPADKGPWAAQVLARVDLKKAAAELLPAAPPPPPPRRK